MTKLEGQEKLTSTFSHMTIEQLPKTIMLLGEYGCGKHTLAKNIAEMFFLEYNDVTETISVDLINEIYGHKIPTLYVIDVNKLKDQNIILKFIEESKDFIFVCLLCDNENLVLNTVMNRCIIYRFEEYSKDFLKQYISCVRQGDEEIALNIFTTIGQLQTYGNMNLTELNDLCYKIATKIQDASITNTLSLVDKFNYKDLYDKYDVSIFFKLLKLILKDLTKQDIKYYNMYMLVLNYSKRLNDNRIRKEDLMSNFLIKFWKLSRGIEE